MNRIIKVGIAAFAMAATVSGYAQEVEAEEEGPVGWTAVCVGLATPVQLPWGLDRWDVFGIDFNVFYSDAPLMYGIDVGGLCALTRDDMMGIKVSGLLNFACSDVYGLRATLGMNFCGQTVYGMEAGMLGFRDSIYGLDVEFLGSAQRKMCGMQVGGLANISAIESYGLSIAGITNLAKTSYGLQLSAAFNMTDELHGAQIAIVNYADECVSGFQIGLVNIIMSNRIKVLPIVNGYF